MEHESLGILVAFLVGWVGAQGVKLLLLVPKLGVKGAIKSTFESGGMPSGHSGGVAAGATTAGLAYGFLSPIFQLAVALALIVMYDSIGVRKAVGKQGAYLTKVAKALPKAGSAPKVVKGHTLLEIFAGAVFGIGVGCGVYLLMY